MFYSFRQVSTTEWWDLIHQTNKVSTKNIFVLFAFLYFGNQYNSPVVDVVYVNRVIAKNPSKFSCLYFSTNFTHFHSSEKHLNGCNVTWNQEIKT